MILNSFYIILSIFIISFILKLLVLLTIPKVISRKSRDHVTVRVDHLDFFVEYKEKVIFVLRGLRNL